jgi:hypothetical protein
MAALNHAYHNPLSIIHHILSISSQKYLPVSGDAGEKRVR